MEFLLSSRSRVIVQLNREKERSFGVEEFTYAKPVRLDDEGKTSLLITPVSDCVNRGGGIALNYTRRVINSVVQVPGYTPDAIEKLIRDLEVACRVEFEPGSWSIQEDESGTWLHIDDFVVISKIKLECVPNETI